MKIIDLLDHDEQAVCRAKGIKKVQDFTRDNLNEDQTDQERFEILHAYFRKVSDKTDHCAENFDEHKFKRRGNDREDIAFLKLLASGNIEGVQMLDEICDEMLKITLSAETGMTKTFKLCSTTLGMQIQRLEEGKNIISLAKVRMDRAKPVSETTYGMVVGK